jgi:hypothetical protein
MSVTPESQPVDRLEFYAPSTVDLRAKLPPRSVERSMAKTWGNKAGEVSTSKPLSPI